MTHAESTNQAIAPAYRSEPVSFPGALDAELSGIIEWPLHGKPKAWALFAHCFTCSKNSLAATRISRALAERGFAVLRFDFTGLGDSEGEFGAAGFAADVTDLQQAAGWLTNTHGAPSILIGHSLGGAAVLMAAKTLPSVRAVATIGSPSSASHVLKNIVIEEGSDGKTLPVRIGGRSFTLTSGFVAALRQSDAKYLARDLGRPLLIMHSPADSVVEIEEAHALYKGASHPKSFIGLDQADHLLTRREDADYVADVIATWATRYLPMPMTTEEKSVWQLGAGEVWIGEHDKAFWRAMQAGRHHVDADEPIDSGGTDRGPTPYDLLLMSLGACTSMTLRLYAERKGYPLHDVQVLLRHERVHADDCASCEGHAGKVELITRELVLAGPLSTEQREDLKRVADRCPVHRTLEGRPIITTKLMSE